MRDRVYLPVKGLVLYVLGISYSETTLFIPKNCYVSITTFIEETVAITELKKC